LRLVAGLIGTDVGHGGSPKAVWRLPRPQSGERPFRPHVRNVKLFKAGVRADLGTLVIDNILRAYIHGPTRRARRSPL
jgi:hypothetical protein